MNKTPLRHMMLHADTLADEFEAILGYRTSHEGLVQSGDDGITYHISTSGTGSGDGSLADPFADVSELPTLVAGDVVGFKRGDTFAQMAFVIGQSGTDDATRITFKDYGSGAKPIFDGELALTPIIDARNRTFLRFENLAVRNCTDISGAANIALGSSSTTNVHDIEIVNCDFNNGTVAAQTGDDGVFCTRAVDLYVEGCTFEGSDNHIACHPNAAAPGANLTIRSSTFKYALVSSIGEASGSGGSTTVDIDDNCVFESNSKICALGESASSIIMKRSKIKWNGGAAASYINNLAIGGISTPAVLRYCLIDYTGAATTNTFINAGVASSYTFQNCTFYGNNGGSPGADVYVNHASGVMTFVNCVFYKWYRCGRATALNTADYCYMDNLTAPTWDTNTNDLDHTDFATAINETTFRPTADSGKLLDAGNKGTDLGLGPLTDLAGDAVTVATPTRGCYENAA